MANINIGGRLHSTATGNVVAGANEILDDTKGKKQSVINQETDAALAGKQAALVSGTNIKTVNGESILGSGNIQAGDPDAIKYSTQTLTDEQKTQARTNIGAYNKPVTGIPATDLASAAQTSLGKADTAYQKPQGGVPKSDLASGVQDSLDLADTAVQAENVGPILPPPETDEFATKTQVTQLEAKVDDLIQDGIEEDDLDISDENGYAIVRFKDGGILTKNFDSSKCPAQEDGSAIADFNIVDEDSNIILSVRDGYPVTKNFDGKQIAEREGADDARFDAIEEDVAELETKVPQIDSVYGWEEIDPTNPLKKIRFDAGLTPVIQHWGFIGDSLSSGCHGYDTGVGTATGVDIYDYSWGQMICRICGSDGYNFSYGGGSAKMWLTNQDRGWPAAQLEQNWKQAYTIAFGINDSAQLNSLYPDGVGDSDVDLVVNPSSPYDYSNNNEDTFVGCYGGIIQRLRSVNPRCRIFVLTMLDKNVTGATTRLAMDAEIRKIAAKFDDVYCIDLATYAPQYYGSPLHDVLVYWSHLTSVGYLWLAYLINTYIDWIIRQNLYAFRDIALIGTDKYMNQNIH